MNINSLKLKKYKNYKELCGILDEDIKTGKSKQLQLKDWERYFTWEKEGHKFIVTEIYDKPKEKIDGRKVGNTGKSEGSRGNNVAEYIGNIEKLILNLLVQDKDNANFGRVFLSKNVLLRTLNMVNDNYAYCKRRIPKLSKFMNINQVTINEWYDSTSSMLERNLETALKDLEKQSLILWSREITVAEAKAVAEMNFNSKIIKKKRVDMFGEKVIDYEYYADPTVMLTHREATDREKRFILRTERETLKEMGMKNKAEVIYKGVWGNFIEKVNNTILEELNIAFYYKSYKILFNEEHISEAIDDFEIFELDDIDKKNEEQKLNTNIKKRITTNAKKRHTKAKNNTKTFKSDKTKRRADKEYVKHNEELNKNLIDVKAVDIKNLVRTTKVGLTEEELKEIESL
jgi:hypothetical protein